MPKSGTNIWWKIREELPYHVELKEPFANYTPAFHWCEQRLGTTAHSDGMCGDWLPEISRFHFKDERIAIEFKLRWG